MGGFGSRKGISLADQDGLLRWGLRFGDGRAGSRWCVKVRFVVLMIEEGIMLGLCLPGGEALGHRVM